MLVSSCALVSAATGPTDKHVDSVRTSDFTPALNGQEVTVTLEVTFVQHVAGVREGEFPTLLIHHAQPDNPLDHVMVYAYGELADVLHRVSLSEKDSLKGRTITATGKVVLRDVLDDAGNRIALYELELRDWRKFQLSPVARTK
jgi:hypothetical protein